MARLGGADRAARQARGAAGRDERPGGGRDPHGRPELHGAQPRAQSMDEAVRQAAQRRRSRATWCCCRRAAPATTCTSDFEERGRDFAARGARHRADDARCRDRDARDRAGPTTCCWRARSRCSCSGTLMVYSASFAVAHNEFNDDAYFLVRQLLWDRRRRRRACWSAMRVDYRRWRTLSLLIMFVVIGLLILVLVPGHRLRSYGAVRWIKLGPRADPAERDRQAGDHALPGRLAGAARADRRRVLQRAAAVRDHRRHRRGAGRGPARPGHDRDHRRDRGVRVLRRRAPTCCTSRCSASAGVVGGRLRCWRT